MIRVEMSRCGRADSLFPTVGNSDDLLCSCLRGGREAQYLLVLV